MKKPRIQKVLLAELSMTGVFHAGVNAGFVRLMREVCPDAELHLHAEKSHIQACRARLSGETVRFRRFPFFPKAGKWTLPLRDGLGSLYALGLFLRSRKKDTLFIMNLLPFTHICIFLLNSLFRRRLFIALHGQLDALLPDSPLRLTKAYLRLHRWLFLWDRRNFYILLGQPVYDAAKHLFPETVRVVVIDHPYDDLPETPESAWKFPLRLGQIGVGNRGKGTENLFRLGELLREEIESGRVELSLVGRLDPELRRMANPWVKWHIESLTDREFAGEVEQLHYTLLMRNNWTGRAIASGAFFDGIKYRKPFLSLENRFVRHYGGCFPGCGSIFPTVEAMAGAIRNICRTMDRQEYLYRIDALEWACEELSVRKIAEQFKRQIE